MEQLHTEKLVQAKVRRGRSNTFAKHFLIGNSRKDVYHEQWSILHRQNLLEINFTYKSLRLGDTSKEANMRGKKGLKKKQREENAQL